MLAQLLYQYQDQPGGLLPLLHAVQADFGYIPADAVPPIARAMQLSAAEVEGVISFYHDFRRQPAGRHTLHICRAESCQAAGGEALVAHLQARLGIEPGQSSADGELTVESVYCLGNCACSPALRIGDATHARVDIARLDALLDSLLESAS
ncbi:formate dehydrogenase subunit gamma [Mangrovimicrobium sediminis]|uniref:NADH-quinone oxidoreductase subunit E n=1 Tax=Mangrovimicrobium sediminis TaxID=2562682 RepID=A0A4Z0M9V4_9GAMM|nr:formate dehydrogenase subunit gamma [Haliea sp. SAOS-164]